MSESLVGVCLLLTYELGKHHPLFMRGIQVKLSDLHKLICFDLAKFLCVCTYLRIFIGFLMSYECI